MRSRRCSRSAAWWLREGKGYILDFNTNIDRTIDAIDLEFVTLRFGACP